MSKKFISSKTSETTKSITIYPADPAECPFREFRDHELGAEYWGMGPVAFRASYHQPKSGHKPVLDQIWIDEQQQPLPRSVRLEHSGWIRAEDLAHRWGADVVVNDETEGKMCLEEYQLTYPEVLMKSSFCRRVLSLCYLLERVIEPIIVEHQWDGLNFTIGQDGWRAKYHIYSPGMKAGGGPQHRPALSKNGCYLVRLYHLGAWRCVWVNDQVPVDADDLPVLPFSPTVKPETPESKAKQGPLAYSPRATAQLWPLLICKALLKLAAPNMIDADENIDLTDDFQMKYLDLFHSVTGCMTLKIYNPEAEFLWSTLKVEVPLFKWDDDNETLASTVKSKSTKKTATKEVDIIRRGSIVAIVIEDTKHYPSYALPGISPGLEMNLLIKMIRDLPIKKPLPEPEVPLWKTYRWVDWARSHGLYGDYDCPRDRFLKVNSLLKQSYAPHLLNLQSTESLTQLFRVENEKPAPSPPVKATGKKGKDAAKPGAAGLIATNQNKDDLHEWILYDAIKNIVKIVRIVYYPSVHQYTTATNVPPMRITKLPNRALDIPIPKTTPLYLQIDSLEENILRLSLSVLYPRILSNCGQPLPDYVEPAYMILEVFEWFQNYDVPNPDAYIQTRGYGTVEFRFQPGRHFCRVWVHSRTNWHLALLSKSTLLLGPRDLVMAASVRECPWNIRFLTVLGTAFSTWIRVSRINGHSYVAQDREFYAAYRPDLPWVPEVVGCSQEHRHWMFRNALCSVMKSKMEEPEFSNACVVLRRYFYDPDFGMPPKPKLTPSYREMAGGDPCDCGVLENEETEVMSEPLNYNNQSEEPKDLHLTSQIMDQLPTPPAEPAKSIICELATEELTCEILKEGRELLIRKHEAATVLQAHWRGRWARKNLSANVVVAPDILKSLMDHVFGHTEALSALMLEFFKMYPGAINAYSVASALKGLHGFRQYTGVSPITPRCSWIPFFQGVFYCHEPVRVHLDLHSSLPFTSVAIYNNDTGEQLPQVHNAHVTFDIQPNIEGYTVMGHGIINKSTVVVFEAHWQLTVLCSTDGVFHICDFNDLHQCKELPLTSTSKLHIDEMFIPNRRKILGIIQVVVTKQEFMTFRAVANTSDLEMEAVLQYRTFDGDLEEAGKCVGRGEIYWPYMKLTPPLTSPIKLDKKATNLSIANMSMSRRSMSAPGRSLRKPISSASKRSFIKIKDSKLMPIDLRNYFIIVSTPSGWPLTTAQWVRIDELRNTFPEVRTDTGKKQTTKEKGSSAKDKHQAKSAQISTRDLQSGDAFVELECSLSIGGSTKASRDDERDLDFAATRKNWEQMEPGRSSRGALIRSEFREEFLVPPPKTSLASLCTIPDELIEELNDYEMMQKYYIQQQGPTPATETSIVEEAVAEEEEPKYLTKPEHLKDKFIPLDFVPFCTKDKEVEECVTLTADIAKAAKIERQARIVAALQRMAELQLFNETHVLKKQRMRCQLIENIFTDATINPEVKDAYDQKNEAIAQETLRRTLSATKKKLQEAKEVKGKRKGTASARTK